MKQYRVYPYKMGSKSAGLLAEGLREAGERCFKVYPDRKYRPRASHTIINWGCSKIPNWNIYDSNVLNHPDAVRDASNKWKAFELMKRKGVSIPEFTTDPEVARTWIWEEKATVVSRYKLQGHSGDGIKIFDNYDVFLRQLRAPLYVKYIKKQDEYRVHVFNGKVIDVQQKKKKREVDNDEVDYQVRNHANGWVYCRDDLDYPPSILSDATSAVAALGLDFGGVDIIWNEYNQKSYVLECNTAVGLEGTTLTKYINAIQEYTNAA